MPGLFGRDDMSPNGILGPAVQRSIYQPAQRLYSAMTVPGYMQTPNSAAADLQRTAFWHGSMMGAPDEEVEARKRERALALGMGALTFNAPMEAALQPVIRSIGTKAKAIAKEHWMDQGEVALEAIRDYFSGNHSQ